MSRLGFILLLISAVCACSDESSGDFHGVIDNREYIGNLLDSFSGDSVYLEHLPQMPDLGCEPLYTKRFAESFHHMFNDSNYIQIIAADSIGIRPIDDLRTVWNLRKPLVKVSSCAEYFVDTLKHSYPYLVPEAAILLKDIGRAFNDSLRTRGGGEYRIRVTSVLRTRATVKRLRRVNRNAVDTSAHQFGTTFDIAYNKFICDGTNHPRTAVDLKNLLAEIVEDMHIEGRCFVKYEYKQACFHITVRP